MSRPHFQYLSLKTDCQNRPQLACNCLFLFHIPYRDIEKRYAANFKLLGEGIEPLCRPGGAWHSSKAWTIECKADLEPAWEQQNVSRVCPLPGEIMAKRLQAMVDKGCENGLP
jgi:hypothetical protein